MATDRISGLSIGAAIKAACTVTSTTALTLSGVQVVDGISVGNAGERVLERNATNTANNGIWTARSSSWIRAQDCDGSKDLIPGTLVYVDRGTAYARTFWVFNSSETSTAITVGTEALSLSPVSVALSGVSAWVQNNLFPVVSAASAVPYSASRPAQTSAQRWRTPSPRPRRSRHWPRSSTTPYSSARTSAAPPAR